MPVGTGPSQGFMGRMMGQMPGMMNAMAQNYGSPDLQGAARGTSALLGAPRRRKLLPGGKQQPPPTVPPAGGPQLPMDSGVVGPQQAGGMSGVRDFIGMPNIGGMFGGGNTGITGGMFPRGPMMGGGPMMRPQVMPQQMMAPEISQIPQGAGNFWDTYSRMGGMRRPMAV